MSPELQALLNLVSGGGAVLAPVFAFLWWMERQEGQRKDAVLSQLLERTLNALNGNANALGDLRVYLGLNRTIDPR